MKKSLSIILLVLFLPSFAFAKTKSLGGTYYRDGDSIYTSVVQWGKDVEVTWVDVKTFKVISGIYAKDQYNIYVQGSSPAGVHKKTFHPIAKTFSADRNHVYWIADLISGADVKSFKSISSSYGRDKMNVYFQSKIISGADVKSFQVIDDNLATQSFSKDKNNVYKGEKKTTYDAKTFKRKWIYNFDKNGITCESQFVQKLKGDYDIKSFQVLKDGYAKDKNAVYKDCVKLDWVSPKGFVVPKK